MNLFLAVVLPLTCQAAGIPRSWLHKPHLPGAPDCNRPLLSSLALEVTQLKHCLTGGDNQSHLLSEPSLSLVPWHLL